MKTVRGRGEGDRERNIGSTIEASIANCISGRRGLRSRSSYMNFYSAVHILKVKNERMYIRKINDVITDDSSLEFILLNRSLKRKMCGRRRA